MVVAPVGIVAGAAREPLEGFGFLVARREDGGCSVSVHEPAVSGPRAAGHELLHCMLGGGAGPRPSPARRGAPGAASEDLSRTIGIASPPAALGFVRWPRAVPQRPRPPRADAVAVRAADDLPGSRSRVPTWRASACRTPWSRESRRHHAHLRPYRSREARAMRPPRPGRVRVRAIHEQELSPPSSRHWSRARMPISSTVSRQSAANDGHRIASRRTPRPRLGQHEVGVGPDPGRAARRDWNEVPVPPASSPSAATSAAVVAKHCAL